MQAIGTKERQRQDRIAICVFGVVVFLGVVALGVAVHRARAAARETACRGRVYYIASALRNYQEDHGGLPDSSNGDPPHSWRVLLLPELGYQELYEQYDFAEPWDSETNRKVLSQMPPVFTCPNCADADCTSYFLRLDGGGRFAVIERNHQRVRWTEPRDVDANQAKGSPCDSGGFAYARSDRSCGREK